MKTLPLLLLATLSLFAKATSPRYTEVEHETRVMSDSLRKADAPHAQFITLQNGVTRYELVGPAQGEVVVLVHGASLASWVWDEQIEALTTAGYRVLRYDEYGRGFSDYPQMKYTIELYQNQLIQLLDSLNITDPVHIVAHSFGGFITAFTTSNYPQRFASVTLISPGITTPWFVNFMTATAIARWYVHGSLRKIPKTLAQTLTEQEVPLDPYQKEFEMQWATRGYEYSIISLFEDAVGDYLPYYAKLEENHIPTQLIWGVDDPQAKEKYVEKLEKVVPSLEVHKLGSGHVPHFVDKKILNSLLIDFITEESK